MSKRILAAVDLGFDEGWEKRARQAIEHSLLVAGTLRLPVDLVHVSDVPSGSSLHKGAVELLKRFGADQKQRLAEIAAATRVYPLFLQGQAVPKLIQLSAKKAQYECMVMATHGRTGISRMLLGSVAEEIIRHSKIPVMSLGPEAQQRGTSSWSGGFVVATDLSGNSRKSEKLAMGWAKKFRARVWLAHSFRDGLHPVLQTAFGAGARSSELASVLAPHRERARKAMDLRLKAWRSAGIECDGVIDESHGNARESILDLSKQKRASCIFLGTHGRNAAARAFLGSTAREVVLRSSCPVVTVRSGPGELR